MNKIIKRKFADRPDWTRVLERRFNLTYIDDKELDGYLAITHIDKVNDPLVLDAAYKNLCLADNGYIWTQYFPKACNYSVTTMFNEKQEIIQLYFDICNGNMVSPFGMPCYDDLYLDVVLLSTGEVLLFDEDELQEALDSNDITKEQYDLACFEAKKLIEYVEDNKNELLGLSKKYLDYMITLK